MPHVINTMHLWPHAITFKGGVHLYKGQKLTIRKK
jgi:hypothetical protein